jgi:hypothetical protein
MLLRLDFEACTAPNFMLFTSQACWKPKYVKQKEAARSQAQPAAQESLPQSPSAPGHKTLSGPALLQAQQLTPEELVAQSFQRFQRRLHHASVRWMEARNGGNRGAVSVHVGLLLCVHGCPRWSVRQDLYLYSAALKFAVYF